MSDVNLYQTWWNRSGDGETGMEEEHLPQWLAFLGALAETDLGDCTVLDFGCNRGGLLRLLYRQRPFRQGVGIDLAVAAVAAAQKRAEEEKLPLAYYAVTTLDDFKDMFDLAISTDVIYLLDDLRDHARQLHQALRAKGAYYARHYDYANDPETPAIQAEINRHAAKPFAKVWRLNEIVEAFELEGFRAQIKRVEPLAYLDISAGNSWHSDLARYIEGQYERVYVLRFEKIV